MSSEIAITADRLGKVYRIYAKPEDRLIQMATLGRRRPFTEFTALSDVSFTIRRGETVGIVGRNGSGKSTLLQMICGTLTPSSGTVQVRGRIAALLELGAGFNNEFTGRENVYVNGAILGFSREEMNARFQGIADFAAIGDFIDRPVKTYSSGMFVRLAFAVATAVEPDILVVDEALAVGDEAFQRKCFTRIEALKERGGTILFVSHGSQTIVQLCDRAILLDAGEKLIEGVPKTVVTQYQRLINCTPDVAAAIRLDIKAMALAPPAPEPLPPTPDPMPEELEPQPEAPVAEMASEEPQASENVIAEEPAPQVEEIRDFLDESLMTQSETVYESRGAFIGKPAIFNSRNAQINVFESGSRNTYRYDVEFFEDAHDVGFGMLINTTNGLALGGATTILSQEKRISFVPKGARIQVNFHFNCPFVPNVYFMNAGVLGMVNGEQVFLHRRLDAVAFRVFPSENMMPTGLVDIGAEFDWSFQEQEAAQNPEMTGEPEEA